MRRNPSSFTSKSKRTYTHRNDQSGPRSSTIEIPVTSPDEPRPLPITVHLPPPSPHLAAVKIQSTYRAHLIRNLYNKISTINTQATHLQNKIQQQSTVDSIRSDNLERVKLNESLMSLLLTLDSVPGVDPTVRELRRKVSRRIVRLMEILDAVSESKVEELGEMMWRWEEVLEEMEGSVWKERGVESGVERRELERFCFEKLGFRCMERFLRGV